MAVTNIHIGEAQAAAVAEHTIDDIKIFGDTAAAIGAENGGVIGAYDGNSDQLLGAGAKLISYSNREGFGANFAFQQAFGCSVIELIIPGAGGGIYAEAAKWAVGTAGPNKHGTVVHIAGAELATDTRGTWVYAAVIELAGFSHSTIGLTRLGCADHGHIVGASDSDSQGLDAGITIGIGQQIGEDFRQGFSLSERLNRLCCRIDLIVVTAIGIEGQQAVAA